MRQCSPRCPWTQSSRIQWRWIMSPALISQPAYGHSLIGLLRSPTSKRPFSRRPRAAVIVRGDNCLDTPHRKSSSDPTNSFGTRLVCLRSRKRSAGQGRSPLAHRDRVSCIFDRNSNMIYSGFDRLRSSISCKRVDV